MLRPWLFVGFTGHRKLSQPPERIAAAIRAALQKLRDRTGQPLAAVSSAASGADTLFAETAAQEKLPWTLLLPFPIPEFRKDFDDRDWRRVEALLPRAARTHVEEPGGSPEEAFMECGMRTVDDSDVLVAVWDGKEANGPGGTAEVVAYAREQQKPLLWIHASTAEIVEERLERLPPRPAAGPAGDVDRADYAALQATFRHYDAGAQHNRPWAISLNLTLILLHQVATLVAIAALVWSEETWLKEPATGIKLGLLVIALVLPWFLHHAHEGWMIDRLRAEICRSALSVWPLRQADEIFSAMRLPVELALQRSILLARLLSPPSTDDLAQAKRTYAAERIGGQAGHFTKHAAAALRHKRRLRGLGALCTVLAIVSGATIAFHAVRESDSSYHAIKLFSIGLPLVTTALLSSVAAFDLERRSARYSEMAAFLEGARIRVEHAATWHGFNRAVIEVERTLLLEIWEWYSVARFGATH
jgi:hypothetical protein